MSAQVKNKLGINWKELKLPSAWATQLEVIAERLDHLNEYIESQRGKSYLKETEKTFGELVNKINEAFMPKPARTMKDAEAYALSRKFKGTYLALMTEKDILVKVVILAKGQLLNTVPKYEFTEKDVEVTMHQKVLQIPELDFERPVPKVVVKAVPFACDREKIVGYES